MTPLERDLRERIAATGPIGVDAFMAAANAHYYATRDPLGAAGDFTTAPEISQMYGEMIGAALADAWARAGRPAHVRYVELGPGRGTLAADALRVMRAAGCVPGRIEFVETSPVLRAAQARAVPQARFHDALETLEEADGPLLLVASEFFDALPVRQFVGDAERRVVLDGDALALTGDGPVREDSPARSAAMAALAGLLHRAGGVAIIVDYGHDEEDAVGDTLQALGGHRFAPVLDAPGERDLTAHVDFRALAAAARGAGAKVSRVTSQGSWLETLGIGARAMALAAAHPGRTAELAAQRRRLCDEAEMGRLFKVMALAGAGWPLPAGLE